MPYKVISADGHIESHASLWTNHVAEKYQDRAPKFGKDKNGKEAWIVGDHSQPIGIGSHTGGLPYDQMLEKNMSYRDAKGNWRPGMGTGEERIRHLVSDGVDAEVLFPPVSGPRFLKVGILDKLGDKEAYKAVVSGYNNWLAKEFCAPAPDRLIGTMIVPETGVDDAVAEMERAAKLGIPAVCLNMFPNGGIDPKPEDDRFWAASLDLGMAIAPHQNFGRGQQDAGDGPSDMGSRSRVIGRPTKCMASLVGTGVFDRFPKLQVYYAEADMGWIPFHLESSDDWFLRFYHDRDIRLHKLPSQYWRDHFKACFLYNPSAIKMRYLMGLNMIMWGSDLPHATGSYPNTREVLDTLFRGVPADEKKQILVDNPAQYFHLDPDKELTPVEI
jgi:predicted TIM-barrel fold metal-dependent hydrolase